MSMQYLPQHYGPANSDDREALAKLRAEHPGLRVVDTLADQLLELAEIDHPDQLGRLPQPQPADTDGTWFYYSWRSCLVRVLPEADFTRLRSSRNQLLITPQDQHKFRAARVGIAGLNVGNPAALCLALESGASQMKFADFDTLSVSNLNRFRAGLTDLGLNKAVLSARQVSEIDPYAKIEVWDEGIKSGEAEAFVDGLDVLVEEMDNLPLKLAVREAARARRIPVVMVTGNGSNVIIDIERYDQDPDLPILNGHLRPEIQQAIAHPKDGMTISDKANLARDFMGESFLTSELNESFAQIGHALAGIPQLAESSFLRGAAVCYVVRQITTGRPAPSGRYNLNLDGVIS